MTNLDSVFKNKIIMYLFEDAAKALKDAGLMPEVTEETENEYGSIRYKVYNADKELYIEFLLLFDQGIFVDERVEVYNAAGETVVL